MAKTDVLNKWDIPNLNKFVKDVPKPDAKTELKKAIEQPEKDHIIAVLKNCNWNRNKAAAALGVNRTTLYNKMKKYKISDKNAESK